MTWNTVFAAVGAFVVTIVLPCWLLSRFRRESENPDQQDNDLNY